MILLDLPDLDLKVYSQELSYMTYDFILDNDFDIKPIAKSEAHFKKWITNYPFYANINKEGVILYGGLHGEAFKRHKDAIGNFNKNCVKTEIFSRDILRNRSLVCGAPTGRGGNDVQSYIFRYRWCTECSFGE